jgi:hypothetical protein
MAMSTVALAEEEQPQPHNPGGDGLPVQAPPQQSGPTLVKAGGQVATDTYVPKQSGGTCWAHAGSSAASNATQGKVCYTPSQVADFAGKPYYGTGQQGVTDVPGTYAKIPGICVFPYPGSPKDCFVPGTSGVMKIEGGGTAAHAVSYKVIGQGPNPVILIKDSAVGGSPQAVRYSEFPAWQQKASAQFGWTQPAQVRQTMVFRPK